MSTYLKVVISIDINSTQELLWVIVLTDCALYRIIPRISRPKAEYAIKFNQPYFLCVKEASSHTRSAPSSCITTNDEVYIPSYKKFEMISASLIKS